ncbi:hypothetical protein ACLMJK_007833 [Lecanora helva]
MADVRSLLRNERAQRRINHPQATYTATGTLECSTCHIPLKSDQEIWDKHLKSSQHAMRQEQIRLQTGRPSRTPSVPDTVTSNKKRKADDQDDDSRKKTRPISGISRKLMDDINESNHADPINTIQQAPTVSEPEPIAPSDSKRASTTLPSHPMPPPANATQPAIDEDEWAAFERDVATPPPDPSLPSALTAEATIVAAPLSAAEIAAQSREQASQQKKERLEAEIEGEKEDATRALEEEFDEMEGLEERVARLKRMREELRITREKAAEKGGSEEESEMKGEDESGQEDEESDYEEDLYGWGT